MSLKIKFALIPVLILTQYCMPKTQNTAASKAPAAGSGEAQETGAQLRQRVVTPYDLCLEHIESTVGTDCLRLQLKLNKLPKKNLAEYKALTKLFRECHEELELRRRLCNNAYQDFQGAPNPPDFDSEGDPSVNMADCLAKATASRADCKSNSTIDFDLNRCQDAYEKDVENCLENYMRSIAPNAAGTGFPSAPGSPAMPGPAPGSPAMPGPAPGSPAMPGTAPTGTRIPSATPIVP